MAKQVELEYTVCVKAVLAPDDADKEGTREEMAEVVRGHLEDDSDPGNVYSRKDGRYAVTKWVVSLKEKEAPVKRKV